LRPSIVHPVEVGAESETVATARELQGADLVSIHGRLKRESSVGRSVQAVDEGESGRIPPDGGRTFRDRRVSAPQTLRASVGWEPLRRDRAVQRGPSVRGEKRRQKGREQDR